MLSAKVDSVKVLMSTVKQNVFLILNGVPVTFVTDPEFIRPSVPVIAHFLNQEVVARKAKARKCTAEVQPASCWEYPCEGRTAGL